MTNLAKRVLAVILASSFSVGVQVKPARSNPAALAPALCATGVGCALVGTVVAGGVLYYVWEYGGGKKVAADAAGNIRRMLVDPEDPEGSMAVPENAGFYARNQNEADQRCRKRGFLQALPKKDFAGGKYYVCR